MITALSLFIMYFSLLLILLDMVRSFFVLGCAYLVSMQVLQQRVLVPCWRSVVSLYCVLQYRQVEVIVLS